MKFQVFSILILGLVSSCLGDVMCNGNEYSCPDRTTCCKTASGAWACCPMPNAVCCNDHEHCCPENTKCNLEQGTCDNKITRHQASWHRKLPAQPLAENVSRVTCADQESTCPDGTTCCLMKGGGYGCCPMPNAVCCTDHVHCCPHGTTCDLQTQTCNKGDGTSHQWFHKKPASKTNGIMCPDGRSGCPTGSTCCKIGGSGGQYGCCPMPRAVCCSDHIHCCPHGSVCDTAKQQCIKANGFRIGMSRKFPAAVLPEDKYVTRKTCGDSDTCPDDTTCCKTKSGSGCCPFRNGVCCKDQKHCCPRNSRCDLETSKCVFMNNFVSDLQNIFESSSATEIEKNLKYCPNGDKCPAPGTCCRKRNGHEYTCCSIPNAVCCEDYCCPSGYRCGKTQGKCVKQIKQWFNEGYDWEYNDISSSSSSEEY